MINMTLKDLPADVIYILQTLQANGHSAYIVGGCVRDCIMGRIPYDWDITTSAEPYEIKSCFRKTFDTGIKHGTITVVLHDEHYEVTTFRIDGEYIDGRHPDKVLFTKNLTADLARRDFTINAIAFHPDEGFVDPFCGILDIKNKIIRGVGDPSLRFKEDALRILRAIRFSGQLDFYIEEKTFDAIKINKENLLCISVERIREELTKLLLSDHPEYIALIHSLDLSMPIDFVCDEKTIKYLQLCPKRIASLYAILFLDKEIDKVRLSMNQLRFDRTTEHETAHLVMWAKYPISDIDYPLRKFISLCGVSHFENILNLKDIISPPDEKKFLPSIKNKFKEIIKNNNCLNIKNLAVSGKDLLDCGLNGKKIGETLEFLLDHVLRFPEKNEKEYLLNLKF